MQNLLNNTYVRSYDKFALKSSFQNLQEARVKFVEIDWKLLISYHKQTLHLIFEKLVKSQSGHAEKVTSDLQRVFPHDHCDLTSFSIL